MMHQRYETVNLYLTFTLENAKLWVASISSSRLPRVRVLVNKQSVVTSYEEKSENAEGISTMHLGPGVEPQKLLVASLDGFFER